MSTKYLPKYGCLISRLSYKLYIIDAMIMIHVWARCNMDILIFIGSDFDMMTSSNGNIFRVTGPLWREFTGPGEFPTKRPVTRGFDVFFVLRLNKPLSKQPWGWWFETLSRSLWLYRNEQYQMHVEVWCGMWVIVMLFSVPNACGSMMWNVSNCHAFLCTWHNIGASVNHT